MKRKQRLKEALLGYGFLLPSLAGVGWFVLIPFIDAVRRSFTTAMTGEFVGLSNYIEVLDNKAFKLAAGNTARFMFTCIPLLLVISLLVSVLLINLKHCREILKTAFLVPMAIPVASVVMLWRVMFHEKGLLNMILSGLSLTTIDWMNSDAAFFVLIFSYLWKNTGYNIILWLGGLNNISDALYEAAMLDGCGRVRSFIYITLPNLKGTIFTVIILSVINTFKVFREAYLVAGNYPNNNIYLLQHLFNNWFLTLDIQKLCAGAVLLAICITLFICLISRLDKSSNT